MNDMETELETELAKSLTLAQAPNGSAAAAKPSAAPAAPVASLRDRQPATPLPAARPQSLLDQMQTFERVEREMFGRLRRETIELRCTVERKIADAHADYARRLSEETARLERERDETVLMARDEYHTRLAELERLLRRRSGQT